MRLSRSDWDRLAKSIACLALATWGAALVTTRCWDIMLENHCWKSGFVCKIQPHIHKSYELLGHYLQHRDKLPSKSRLTNLRLSLPHENHMKRMRFLIWICLAATGSRARQLLRIRLRSPFFAPTSGWWKHRIPFWVIWIRFSYGLTKWKPEWQPTLLSHKGNQGNQKCQQLQYMFEGNRTGGRRHILSCMKWVDRTPLRPPKVVPLGFLHIWVWLKIEHTLNLLPFNQSN